MMVSGKSTKKFRGATPVVTRRQGLPWMTIGAVAVVLALVGGIFAVVYSQSRKNTDAAAVVAPFKYSDTNKDPSTKIADVYAAPSTVVAASGTLSFPAYKAALHVSPTQRVAYDRFPPVGGPHDAEWADCNGTVYTVAVRDENMVHTLEHGAIWIAYNPAKIAAGDLAVLTALVKGKSYISLTPYPTLDRPISVQAWAHQLKVDSASDVRIRQFITALQANPYIAPEPNGECAQPGFAANPTPFDPSKRAADAVKMDGAGIAPATDEAVASGGAGTALPSGTAGAAGSTAAVITPSATGSAVTGPAAGGSAAVGTTSAASGSTTG